MLGGVSELDRQDAAFSASGALSEEHTIDVKSEDYTSPLSTEVWLNSCILCANLNACYLRHGKPYTT